MPTFLLTVSWVMSGTYSLEAKDTAAAMQKARDLPLPDDAEYADGFQIDQIDRLQ